MTQRRELFVLFGVSLLLVGGCAPMAPAPGAPTADLKWPPAGVTVTSGLRRTGARVACPRPHSLGVRRSTANGFRAVEESAKEMPMPTLDEYQHRCGDHQFAIELRRGLVVLAKAAWLLLVIVVAASPASYASGGLIIPDAGGTMPTPTLTVHVQPDGEEIGQPLKFYVGVLFQRQVYLKTENGAWQPWVPGSPIPHARSETGAPVHSLNLLDGSLNLSPFSGVIVFVGYGRDEADMFQKPGHLRRVYTVFTPDTAGSSLPVPQPGPTSGDYSCDEAAAASAAPKTAPIAFDREPWPSQASVSHERWALTIEGEHHELNVAIARPSSPMNPAGIVINGHGLSPSLKTAPPSAMVNLYWDSQFASRGYLSVTVGRRGNYGSTGSSLIDIVGTGLLAQYHAGQISYADLEQAAVKYQSASLVAALERIGADPAYQPYLSRIVLWGASGGAPTVLQTAADSAIFQAASSKAIVRLTGFDTAFDTNPDAAPGAREHLTRIAPFASPTLWVGGVEDPITSFAKLSCEFIYFAAAAGFPNYFYGVPGLGHGGAADLFTRTLFPIFSQYMAEQGFPGF